MKKYLLMLLLALTTTMLCACTNEPVTGEEEIIKEKDESELNIPYPNEMPGADYSKIKDVTFDTTKAELDYDEIIDLYDVASRISFMFNVCTPQVNYEDQVEATNPSNGFVMPYARSVDFENYEVFQKYVQKYFAEELSIEFLSSPQFINYDKLLYILEGARGTNIFALESDTYKIVKEENKYIIKVATPFANMDNYDGNMDNVTVDHYEYNDFTLEYIDGAWKFTSFPVIR